MSNEIHDIVCKHLRVKKETPYGRTHYQYHTASDKLIKALTEELLKHFNPLIVLDSAVDTVALKTRANEIRDGIIRKNGFPIYDIRAPHEGEIEDLSDLLKGDPHPVRRPEPFAVGYGGLNPPGFVPVDELLGIDAGRELRDWREDYVHPNGQVEDLCEGCNKFFKGHINRRVCKLCTRRPFFIGDAVEIMDLGQGVIAGLEPEYHATVKFPDSSKHKFHLKQLKKVGERREQH